MKNTNLIFILSIILSLITVSCRDKYDQDESFQEGSDFRIMNAATKFATSPLNVYKDDKLLLDTFLYGTDSKYYRSAATSNNINIKIKDANNVESSILTFNDSNVNNQNITYFLYSPSATSNTLEYIKTVDDINQPDNNKAKIRLANLASNLTSNVDVYINNNKIIASNIPFKKVTDFITVATTDKITVVYTGTTTIVKAITNAPLTSKGVYTYVLGGTLNSANPLFITQFSNTL